MHVFQGLLCVVCVFFLFVKAFIHPMRHALFVDITMLCNDLFNLIMLIPLYLLLRIAIAIYSASFSLCLLNLI